MKRIIVSLLLVVSLLATACSTEREREETNNEGFQIYYLNPDRDGLVSREYELKSETLEEQIEECIEQLRTSPNELTYNTPLGTGGMLQKYEIGSMQLNIYFGEEYLTFSILEEVLVRSAIVKTLVQLEGIDGVIFYVGGAPLRDAKGNVVGIMTADSFVENIGQQTNTIASKKIVLYYATEDGKSLVAQEQTVYTSGNISAERLVMQYLMEGPPSDSGLMRTIPSGTKLISVSTLDGVCFVNLSEGFLNYDFQVEAPVALYSIVNSLCEITGVNKVQISVNGKTDIRFRDLYSLNELYERKLDYMKKEEE